MPATGTSPLGWPKNIAAAGPIARRTLGTTSCGTATSSGRSQTSATAPAATACGARSWPSTREPGTQKKSEPGPAVRASYASSVTSTEAAATTRVGASASVKRPRSIARRVYRRRLPPPLPGRVRRDLEVLQAEARDLGERGRRDRAAPDRARRLLHLDEHDEPRLRRRHEADERRDVLAGRVAAERVRHLCRAGLAGDAVAGDLRLDAGAVRDDVA